MLPRLPISLTSSWTRAKTRSTRSGRLFSFSHFQATYRRRAARLPQSEYALIVSNRGPEGTRLLRSIFQISWSNDVQENRSQTLKWLAFLVAHVLALTAMGFLANAVGHAWDRKIQSDGSHMRLIPIANAGNPPINALGLAQ